VSTTRGEAELTAAKEKVISVAAKIAAGEFDAKPGFYCRFCAYQALCPEMEKHFCGKANGKSAAVVKGKAS
jgi:hypothetical protein